MYLLFAPFFDVAADALRAKAVASVSGNARAASKRIERRA
jgi:hypothetical protein